MEKADEFIETYGTDYPVFDYFVGTLKIKVNITFLVDILSYIKLIY